MRTIILSLFLLSFVLSAQTSNKPEDGVKSKEAETKTQPNTSPDKDKENHATPGGLDKEYYNYYFTTLPDAPKIQKEKLEFNVVSNFKKEIHRREAAAIADEILPKIKAETVKYERVTSDSIWVRGIKSSTPFIRYTEFMYIVKFDKYFAFISFAMDPGKYIQEPLQVELIFKKENPFEAKLVAP